MSRLQAACDAFDHANAQDPNQLEVDGESRPRELVQAQRLSRWVERLEPNPTEALQLAARCQHLERWTILRSDYPEGRVGYLKWRTALGRFHADRAESILKQLGYDATIIAQVRAIVTKQNLRSNPDTQTMEDALCLSFLEHEMEEFSAKHDDAKIVDILQKTWRKMSERGHQRALTLSYSPRVKALIDQALGRRS